MVRMNTTHTTESTKESIAALRAICDAEQNKRRISEQRNMQRRAKRAREGVPQIDMRTMTVMS